MRFSLEALEGGGGKGNARGGGREFGGGDFAPTFGCLFFEQSVDGVHLSFERLELMTKRGEGGEMK